MASIELKARQEQLRTLLDEMRELSQPRSNYALRHFVVAQHDMPARQRQQVLAELQSMMFELANTEDNIRLAGLDIEEMEYRLTNDKNLKKWDVERLKIEIKQKERSIEALQIQLTGRIRECDTLYAMLQEMPTATAEQLEAEEESYWALRLSRQFYFAGRDVGGNLTAILQMLTDPGKPRPELAVEFVESIKALGLSEEAIKQLHGGYDK